jgi:hypothetical protein
LQFYQLGVLPSWCFINLLFYQLAVFINLLFLSTCYFYQLSI